ncbi:MAG: hypothetical protein G01um10143_596 [Parcubacteria group bacterium Gr01-1014_3]|nr:MAG: hypothetical protein G01um10143_596 [Parcubacteria group bacterium Gr01-1014_3]
MKIIQFQESYSSKNLRKYAPWGTAVLLVILFVMVTIALTLVIPTLRQSKYLWVVTTIGLIIILISRKYGDPLFDKISGFQSGKEGEEKILNMLKETLDDSYIYVPNYIIPNTRIGDIDGLLLGPKGVIILEVKNYSGVFDFEAGHMHKKRGWYNFFELPRPVWQTARQKDFLVKFFKTKGVDVRVMAMLVLAGGKIGKITGETGIFITEASKLTNHIFELSPITNWSEEMGNKIISALGVSQK